MSLTYIIEPTNRKYSFSWKEMSETYQRYVNLMDEDFLRQLPDIIHFAVIVCYIKEYGHEMFADTGLIHQLIHLLTIPDDTMVELQDIRTLFNKLMRFD